MRNAKNCHQTDRLSVYQRRISETGTNYRKPVSLVTLSHYSTKSEERNDSA